MKAVALFGYSFLYQSGDMLFYREMANLGLLRGGILLSGLKHKAIVGNKFEYFLTDYDNEEEFCQKFNLISTHTPTDFINELKLCCKY